MISQAMSAMDDDSSLTQLATAWVDMYMGGAKVKEAFDIFQELGDKYNWTVRPANIGCCQESIACTLLRGFKLV